MAQAYLANNTLVLTAAEGYQPIQKLIPGQLVLNMKLEPVKITLIGECLNTPMVAVNYQNWYESLHCSPSQQILVIHTIQEDTCELKWVPAEKLEKGMMIMSVEEIYEQLPETFAVLNGVAPDYSLGLLFGLYAGYGNLTEDKMVEFTFGQNEELVLRVKQLVEQVCPTAVSQINTTSDSVYQVRVTSEELSTLFSEFGNKVERRIPRGYWVRNKNYLQGLFEGLIDYNPELKLCRYISVSREMCEAFVWITSQQAINFEHDAVQSNQNLKVYPLLVRVEQEQSYLNRVLSVDKVAEEKGLYLSVDCATNSVVVNNIVVKCDEEEDED